MLRAVSVVDDWVGVGSGHVAGLLVLGAGTSALVVLGSDLGRIGSIMAVELGLMCSVGAGLFEGVSGGSFLMRGVIHLVVDTPALVKCVGLGAVGALGEVPGCRFMCAGGGLLAAGCTG